MTNRIKWGEPVTGMDGVIAVAQALKDGNPVEILARKDWIPTKGGSGLRASETYRIGEEVKLREFWMNVYVAGSYAYAYERKADADSGAGHGRIECIHVREVIE